MTVKIFDPFTLNLEESSKRMEEERDEQQFIALMDETLKNYALIYLEEYRNVFEKHFPNFGQFSALFQKYPYRITIVRTGKYGSIICFTPAETEAVEVLALESFDPPFTQFKIEDVAERLNATGLNFSFYPRTYDEREARFNGTNDALNLIVKIFFAVIETADFEALCRDLIASIGLNFDRREGEEKTEIEKSFALVRDVTLNEPAGFRRGERWGFRFINHQEQRITAEELRELEDFAEEVKNTIDVICLITSGDLTSIGNSIAIQNPRLRVWDREILHYLIRTNLDVFSKYFEKYPVAVEELSRELEPLKTTRYFEFKERLAGCNPGKAHFSIYEKIGIEILEYVFEGKLGSAKAQNQTNDGVHRRDVLFRNLNNSAFFQHVYTRFHANFIIIDFKNNKAPVGSKELDAAVKYANDQIGKFVIVVSRKGAKSVIDLQMRHLRDNKAVIVISDDQLLEMVKRKESGDDPEDILADLLSELQLKF